jgi:hypothetical protein
MFLAVSSFTWLHVVVSLIGIGAGFVVMWGMLSTKRLDGWTALFLTATVLTSISGFGFKVDHFMPSHAIGILSLVVLAVALYARYRQRLSGAWNQTYLVTALVAQYLNVFVLVVQAFLKVPALKVLAPTQTELPFAAAQLVVLAGFVVAGVVAFRRSRLAVVYGY